MDSDQESAECPLCLEVLEADDLNFYPCTCCYQICRFCWHRIRTDENGLCPACRKPYSENPAQFKPLTDEEIQRVKRERKLKESNKKPKVTESRKHLANLRVVQRNLVFVNGLPSRLADTELLRRNEYFGKYGKIVKLVTSPAHNGQLNSICVYITYSRSEEALRAIQALCNHQLDGRTLKATLGTTKYCSRYLKGATCQKTDCLYLHEPGDPSASFTKEQMQQGLHLDYERKLMEQYTSKNPSTTTPKNGRSLVNGQKNDSPQRRKHSNQPTPLLPPSHSAIPSNGHSDFESGDETSTHATSNGFPGEPFHSTTANHLDSDSRSTSSQTSSEHDPQMVNGSTSLSQTFPSAPSTSQTTTTTTTATTTTTTLWPDDRSTLPTSNHPFLTTDSTSNGTTTVKSSSSSSSSSDPLPEYKLFSPNTPSIHTILFGNQENSTSTHPRPRINTHEHDVREIEKKLIESSLTTEMPSSFFPPQENDELGFDPCSLFMTALASDIEDERRPTPSIFSSRLTSNYQVYPPTAGTLISNGGWYSSAGTSNQVQNSYSSLHDSATVPLPSNGTNLPKPPVQPRYPPSSFNGSTTTTTRPMWNGTPSQTQYASAPNSRFDYPAPQPQRIPANPYPMPTKTPFTSNHPVTSNHQNDGWMNSLYLDPAIISFGTKLEGPSNSTTTALSQWSSSTQSQGSSTLSSGNNLISTSRWPHNIGQTPNNSNNNTTVPSAFANHLISNGIYSPYSTSTTLDDANRS